MTLDAQLIQRSFLCSNTIANRLVDITALAKEGHQKLREFCVLCPLCSCCSLIQGQFSLSSRTWIWLMTPSLSSKISVTPKLCNLNQWKIIVVLRCPSDKLHFTTTTAETSRIRAPQRGGMSWEPTGSPTQWGPQQQDGLPQDLNSAIDTPRQVVG